LFSQSAGEALAKQTTGGINQMKRVNEQVLSWSRRGRKSLRGILGCVSLLSFLALPPQAGAGIITSGGFCERQPRARGGRAEVGQSLAGVGEFETPLEGATPMPLREVQVTEKQSARALMVAISNGWPE
jgi:hypothetical protein